MTTECAADWVSAQTRLLTDRRLRELFRSDPAATARILKIPPREFELFVALNPDQLDAQAHTLMQKRFHEVEKLMPRTFAALGNKAGQLFSAYATTYWPEGHQRHLLDATQFARLLKNRKSRELCASEQNWLEFILQPKKFRVRPVTLRRRNGKKHPAIQILTAFGGRPRQRFLFLG